MKPFTFRLEAVQRLRESEMQDAYEAYGVAIQRRMRLENTARGISQELHDLRAHISNLRENVFPASLQPHFMASLQDAEERLESVLKQLSRAEQTEQEKLDLFLQAKARVDILDKLKDKRRDAHMREQYRAEEKEIEDLVSTRYVPAY